MMAIGDRVWQSRPDLAYRKLVDGGMLFDEGQQQVYHFNETAALVWEACQDGRTTAQIVESFCRIYEMEEAQIMGDVADILAEFRESNLLES